MNWKVFVGDNWALLVDWLSNDVHNSSKGGWSDWNSDWVSSVDDLLTSDETLGGIESNCSNVVTSKMLGNFQNQSVLDSLYFE